MKHYYSRQREHDDRWEFVVDDDGMVYPVGYCVGALDLDDEDLIESLGGRNSSAYIYYAKKTRPLMSLFHRYGHETKAEACACYQQYLLDNVANFSLRLDASAKCLVCGIVTTHAASVDALVYALCDAHRNRQEVSVLLPALLELFK